MRRGELWTVAGGVYAAKPRPALILQDDRFSETDSVTVCPLTTSPVDAPLLRSLVEPNADNGLEQASFLMVDKLTTVRRSNVHTKVGALSAEELNQVERLILLFLGLAG